MAVSPALTTPERSALAGVSALQRYLSPVPDVTVATARINQSTFTYPLMQLTVDTTSGWSGVKAGMAVKIGTAAGLADVGMYRVRLTPGSTTLYIGETSSQDAGQIPIAIRSAGFADNQYVTVIQDWHISAILPVINPTTGATFEDGTLAVSTNNTTPPPLVNVVVNGRRNHLATLIADGATFALSAVATPTSWPTSTGETFTYLWTTPSSGWSSVSGTTTTTLTASVAPGKYALYLTVTGSLSGATQRVAFIHIHDASTNPPLLISEMPRSDNRDRTGRKMSFDLYNNRLASIPNGAACLYFEMSTWANQWTNSTGTLAEALDSSETGVDVSSGALFAIGNILLIEGEQMLVTAKSVNTLTVTRGYNGTTAAAHVTGLVVYVYSPATDVPTATRQMIGWVQRQDKSAENGLRQATIDLISPSYLLGALNSTSQIVQFVASPANWQQVKPTLSTASFMAWYMLRWRVANVLLLFNFTPFSVAAAGQRLPSWTVDKGTVLQQIQNLATERGNFGCDSEGEFYFLRTPQLVNYADRASIIVRDSVDASIYSSASNPRELTNRAQQVRGEAFSWDGSAVLPTPYYSDAPKVPAQGASQIKLPAQVVTGQAELNQLTGDRYAQANNPYPTVTCTVKRNRDVIEPAQMEFVAITIPANLSADGTAYSGNIVPLSVTKTHNPDGTSDITVAGEGETHGVPGSTVPVPVPNDSLYTPGYVPTPLDALPPLSLGDFDSIIVPASVPSAQGSPVSPGKGAIWVNAAGTAIKRTLDITLEPPTVDDVTPSDAFFTDFVMVVHDKSTNFSRGAYALGNDGTDSKIAYTTDIYADTVIWTVGAAMTGIYTQMESAGLPSLAGGVVAYCPATDEVQQLAYDFSIDEQGWIAYSGSGIGDQAAYVPLTGWGHKVPNDSRITIWITFGAPINITSVRVVRNAPVTAGTVRTQSLYHISGGVVSTLYAVSDAAITDITYPLSIFAAPTLGIDVVGDIFATGTPVPGQIIRVVVTHSGAGPTNAVVSVSTDYGATSTPTVIGDTPGPDAAFCLSRFGVVALAAVDEALEKAATFGGAFSSVTGGGTTATWPLAARIPWKIIGDPSRTNNGTSPDFYLASEAAISTESLWKVKAGVQTAITPDVSGTNALAPTSNSIGTYASNRICFIGDIGGTRRIFSSKDSGATWVYSTVTGTTSVRAQRFSSSGLIWIAATTSDVKYSDDGGISWDTRTVSGGGLQAEIFG